MTTRAGFTGLITGVLLSVFLYPLYAYGYQMYASGRHVEVVILFRIGIVATLVLLTAGGFLAARWSRSTMPDRCAVLGGLAGGLAAAMIYCFWGAGAAGTIPDFRTDQIVNRPAQAQMVLSIIDRSMKMYLVLVIGGSLAGMLGGYLSRSGKPAAQDVFDKVEPQMAMNVAITSVPACIVALTIVAVIFPRVSFSISRSLDNPAWVERILDLPLVVSLLNLLISHIALTLVVPHEARESEHRCGMDEVKMAAFVGIGATPLTILLLLVIDPGLFTKTIVLVTLLACAGLSLISLYSLLVQIFPKKATFQVPQDSRQKIEASLFGTIARSHGPRLVMLCVGCGVVMVLPLCISVLSLLVNLSPILDSPAFAFIPAGLWRLFQMQALVNGGTIGASVFLLIIIYLFYLNLGRWFSKWNSKRHSATE